MQKEQKYILNDLPYGYKDLEPYISEEVLRLHHDKHHKAYVDTANSIIDRIKKARARGDDLDYKSNMKALSFNVGGAHLHDVYWRMMAPAGQGGVEPIGNLGLEIIKEYGSLERFKKEFSDTALTVEGSGWAVLIYTVNRKLLITQIEKHNINVFPDGYIVLPLDVWEHAYYLDYKNERMKFIEAFWNIVNWEEASRSFDKYKKIIKNL